jgi:hypothetical protein
MYTGIYDSFWTDRKVEDLPDEAKLLFLYLITCPHRNIIGFYRLPKKYIAADLGWSVERVSKVLETLCEAGLIGYDEAVSIVLVRKFLRHNTIENPNMQKAAVKKINELEDNCLFEDFLTFVQTLEKPLERVEETVKKRLHKELHKELRKEYRNTEPEPEPEPEPEEEPESMHGAEDAPCQPAAPPVITLTLNDKTEYPVTEEQVEKWATLYPAVDVMQELRKMKGWLDANPSKRKTKNGILRFVNNWLSKEQDRGGYKARPSPPAFKNYDDGEDFLKG